MCGEVKFSPLPYLGLISRLDHFGLFSPAAYFDDILKFYDAALAPLSTQRKDLQMRLLAMPLMA